MKTIADNTCTRFQPRKNEADFVQIQNERDEGLVCWRFLLNKNGIIMTFKGLAISKIPLPKKGIATFLSFSLLPLSLSRHVM